MAPKSKKPAKLPSGIDQHGELWRVRISRQGFQVRETFPSLDEAVAFRAKTLLEIKGNSFKDTTSAKRKTLVQLLQDYLDGVTPTKKGERTETSRIKLWQKVEWAKLPITDVHPSHITAWRNAEVARGMAPSTIGNMMNTLSAVFKHAKTGLHLTVDNPVTGIARPQKRPARIAIPNDHLEAQLVAAAKGSQRIWLAYFLQVAAWTAMREGEIRFLRISDLNFDGHVIRVRSEDQGGSKTGMPRDVPMLDEAKAALQEWLSIRPADQSNDGWVFPSPTDPSRPISLNTVSGGFARLMNNLLENAPTDQKPKKITFHDLRHWGVTRMAPLHMSVLDLSLTTGHKTLEVLRDYFNPDPVERAAEVRARSAAKKARSSSNATGSDSSVVRNFLIGQGMKPGSIFEYIERATNWYILGKTAGAGGAQFENMSGAAVHDLIDEAFTAICKHAGLNPNVLTLA